MNKEIEYIQNRAQGIARYSDKLRKTMTQIDEPLREGFKQAGIKHLDTEDIFRESVDQYIEKYYRLKITKAADDWKVWVDE